MKQAYTIDQIRNIKEPTKEFLCSLEDNIYGIEFVYFKIRNADTNQLLF